MDDRIKTILAGGAVIVAAIFLLWQFHYKDSLFFKCSKYSPVRNEAACLTSGGMP